MQRILVSAGTALSLIGMMVWFTHRPRPETAEPPETRSASGSRASAHASPAGDFSAGFHAIAHDEDRVRRAAELTKLAERWIEKNPLEALDFALRLPAGELRETFLRQLLGTWAGKDVQAALSWSDGLETEAERKHARSMLCIAFSEKSGKPDQAIELAVRHGAEEGGDGLLENLTMQWAARETPAALEWARRQPAGEWRDRLMARVVFVLAKSDPFDAACQVAKEMEPGPIQNEATISVLHQWAMSDFAAASDWAETLPACALRDRAMNELAGLRSSVPSGDP